MCIYFKTSLSVSAHCPPRGPRRTTLYNESFVVILSKKHPNALGMPFDRVWSETAKDVEPVFAKAEVEGCATTMEDTTLFLERHGYVEEYVHFTKASNC